MDKTFTKSWIGIYSEAELAHDLYLIRFQVYSISDSWVVMHGFILFGINKTCSLLDPVHLHSSTNSS